MSEKIILTEADRNDIFKNGELCKVGVYWIGWDLTFGIHIPTQNKSQAQEIMKRVESTKQLEQYKSALDEIKEIDDSVCLDFEEKAQHTHDILAKFDSKYCINCNDFNCNACIQETCKCEGHNGKPNRQCLRHIWTSKSGEGEWCERCLVKKAKLRSEEE